MNAWEGPVDAMGVEVVGRGERCPGCDECLFTIEQMEQQQAVAAAKVVARSIQNGREFKLVRKVARLGRADVATMLGVPDETVSRWEGDELAIPREAVSAVVDAYARSLG